MENDEILTYLFNVETEKTFIVVGGTLSATGSNTNMEYTIVPPEEMYVFSDYEKTEEDYGYLDEEYIESEYAGIDEMMFETEGVISVNVVAMNQAKGYDPENPDDSLSTDVNGTYPISKDKDKNIREAIKAIKKQGVTNKYAICGMLAVASKESGFVPQSEASYRKTSADRIRKIFGGYSAIKSRSDSQIDALKANDKAFFDAIYGGMYENGPDEGYKYRGRGFNQITFKSAYRKFAKSTGLNLINDPDLLNTVDAAARCMAEYFKTTIPTLNAHSKQMYHFNGNINSFTSLDDAVGAMYHANAGTGYSYEEILKDKYGGRKKSFEAAGPLYKKYQKELEE